MIENYDTVYHTQYSEPAEMRISETRDSAAAYGCIIFSMLESCHAVADDEYESFDVLNLIVLWFETNGPELIELDEILDKFVQPSNLLQ